MELLITRQVDEGTTTLVLTGSIDLVTRDALHQAGLEVIEAGQALVFDMMGVEFIDSTGIGTLVELQMAARAAGVEASISRRSARVERILEITGLTESWATA